MQIEISIDFCPQGLQNKEKTNLGTTGINQR